MAAKPRKRLTIREIKSRNYSPAYEKRLIRAARSGKSRQAARGHKKHEHIERKQKENERYGITLDQRRSIVKYYEHFDPELHPWKYSSSGSIAEAISLAPKVENFVDFATANGYDRFKEYRKIWDAARRGYKRESANKSYSSRGQEYLSHLAGLAKVEDVTWLYYH
jgi:hypothetical protein